jgi:hypothetical protein
LGEFWRDAIVLGWLKPDQWLEVWERVSGEAQLVILESLSWTLPGGVVLELERFSFREALPTRAKEGAIDRLTV